MRRLYGADPAITGHPGPVEIRPARRPDLPGLTDLYNHYVETSPATFDTEPFSLEQRAEWFSHYPDSGPHRMLVAERDGALLGYACSSPFHERPGYRTSVSVSAYVAPAGTGQGVGRALYSALLPLVFAAGMHRAYAGIALPNPASVALHRSFGFRPAGLYREVGMKFGRYLDVEWYELAP